MVIDFAIYVLKSWSNSLNIYAYDVGKNGVDLRNFVASAMPDYFYWYHDDRV
tara:strand:+ start:5104 stop:5259 length:156 start_codon:yes stop_codon:yes gene_type:complete